MRNLGFAALVFVLGCSSNGDSGMDGGGGEGGGTDGGSDPGAAFKSACADYGKAICARGWACGESTSVPYDDFRPAARPADTQQACADAVAADCVAVHAMKGVLETADDVSACAQKTTTTCTVDPPHCGKKGSLADGASCNTNIQCASGACVGAEEWSCGKCGTPKGMDGCGSNTDCTGIDNKLYCYNRSICDTVKKSGEPCTDKSLLEDGLTCFKNQATKAGASGDTCDANSPECGVGLFCDNTQHCAAKTVGGVGTSCGGSGTICSLDTVCSSGSDGGGSICAKLTFVGEGMNCGGDACKPDLFCDRTPMVYSCKKRATCN